ncbi:B3 domain-containing protein At3g25182-like [Solanum stenotomum]|uniref:B3 domain-containing protein At3g25182-like n=1 Tax=Solanum stenotomum TaxID=172797 RepID=UPI0020D09535|nr:B3 domain-containing protein At3g25182-like [Solanum stenotomum]
MVFTQLSLDDFSGMRCTRNMNPIDYMLAVSEVSCLKSKYGEEDNLIAEQDKEFRYKKEERNVQNIQSILSSYSQVLDRRQQKHPVLDCFVPKGKLSKPNRQPRKFTERFDGEVEPMIKKAVENNSEEDKEQRVVKVDDEEKNRVNRGSEECECLLVEKSGVKKRKINHTVEAVAPPVVILNRELSIEFKNQMFIGGSVESAKLVIEKILFDTDVNPAEGRLSIPQKQMTNRFLNTGEEQLLNTRNGAKMSEMNVSLIEPSRQVVQINLRKWTMNKNNGKTSSSYVLVKHWNDVTKRNGLKSGMKMQLWAFRKDENLCFALVKV